MGGEAAAMGREIMLFYEIINKHPAESSALVCQDKMLTYGQLRAEITLWAAHLQSHGVRKGDKVGLFSKNCSEFVIAYLAIIKAGGVVVPFNFQLAAPEVAYIVQDADMKVMVARQKLELDAALQERGCGPLVQLDFDDLRQRTEHAYAAAELDENDNCTIIYTSGTTGYPKGAMLSHRNLVANAHDFTERVLMHSTDKSLCVLPMYHCFAWTVSVSGPLLHGGCIVVQENYTLLDALRLIQKYQINQFAGVPTMIQMFEKGGEPEQLASVRFFISGGASLPQKLAKDFKKKFGKPVQEGYGLSEASPVCTVNPAEKIKIGSIGPQLPNVQVEIRDDNDQSVANGTVGELCVRGANVMLGYLNRPEATAAALRGGWLHTGDLAYRDDEGYIFIVDRLKDMIITGGENVYPREVEEALYTHPAVQENAVVGVPDKLRGQAVCAYVVLKEGQEATKPQLRRFLMERMANYKVPKYFFFCEQLPKNGTGKIMKTALRENAVEDLVNRQN